MNKNQEGNSHVVLIITLILVILGLLGFVFWQNFIDKKTDSTTSEVQSNETAKNDAINDGQKEGGVAELTTVRIEDLALKVTVPLRFADLISEPIHLEGDQAVNSVVLSTQTIEKTGCVLSSAPLGIFTYDSDKGGVFITKTSVGDSLYYIQPKSSCSAVTSNDLNELRSALQTAVSDNL